MARISISFREYSTFVLLAAVFIGIACAQTPRTGGGANNGQINSGSNVHHDLSEPLMGMPAILPPNHRVHIAAGRIPQEPRALPSRLPLAGSTPDSPVPATPELINGGAGLTTTLSTFNIAGVGNFFVGPQGTFTPASSPSNATGAVGTTQYLQWVDDSFAIFSKATGSVIYGPAAGNTIWSGFGGPCETTNDGEATVNFDKLAKRWVVSQHAISAGLPYLQCVAVSTTADATGAWNRYSFSINSMSGEFTNRDARLGVWPDAYYVSFAMYDGSTFAGARFCALQRASMLSGAPADFQCAQMGNRVYNAVVADFDGGTPPPAGAPGYFATDDPYFYAVDVYKFHVDWADSQRSTLSIPILISGTYYIVACNVYTDTVCAQQPNGVALDVHGNHFIGRMPYRNYGTHQSFLITDTVGAVPGIYFMEMRLSSNGDIAAFQQGIYQPDTTTARFIPSIAADRAGNIATAYNRSSSTMPVSQFVSSRASSDPPGTFGNETLLNPGNASQTTSTWDARSTLTVDPVDDCTFYYTQQYQPIDGTNNWSTQIENFTLGGCLIPLNLQTSPAGLKVSASGSGTVASQVTTPYTGQFPVGSAVAISASSPQLGTSGTRYVFHNWSDGGVQSHSIKMPGSTASYTANFTTQYQLSTAVLPAASGTVTPAAAAYYNFGTTVNLTATPAAGYVFSGWSSGATNFTSPTTTAVVTRPMIVTAYFTPLPTTLQTTIYSKSGLTSSRVWTFALKNLGPGQANNISISSFSLNQTAGTACRTPVLSTLPLAVRNLAPGSATTFSVMLDVSACASTARFTATINNVENNGASFSSANIANLAP